MDIQEFGHTLLQVRIREKSCQVISFIYISVLYEITLVSIRPLSQISQYIFISNIFY